MSIKFGRIDYSDSIRKDIAKPIGHGLEINEKIYQGPQVVKALRVITLILQNTQDCFVGKSWNGKVCTDEWSEEDTLEGTSTTYPSENITEEEINIFKKAYKNNTSQNFSQELEFIPETPNSNCAIYVSGSSDYED